jgi:hypothetical protein
MQGTQRRALLWSTKERFAVDAAVRLIGKFLPENP